MPLGQKRSRKKEKKDSHSVFGGCRSKFVSSSIRKNNYYALIFCDCSMKKACICMFYHLHWLFTIFSELFFFRDMMMRPNSSSSSSVPNQHLNRVPLPYTGDRVGAPSPIPPATLPPNHSMPAMEEITVAGFSPYLPPSPFTMYHPTSRMVAGGENILPPPGKSHMRSNSDDVTFGFSSMMPQPLNSLPPLVPSKPLERSISGGREVSAFRGRTSESEYDIIRAYMEEEMESGRGTTRKKTNGGSGGEGIASPTCGHYRSVSLDSCFLGRPSSNSGEGEGAYSVEFGDCEFSPDEIERITADEKLAEIVVAEPKRVKR